MATQVKAGLYMGIVSNIKDPEKRGRIKCIIPEVLGIDIESAWCEPCVPVAYDYGGDFCIPKLQETVWISFFEGDPNSPVYLGGWWQEKATPLGSDYSPKDVRIISYGGCMITMHNDTISISASPSDPMKDKTTEITIKEGKITLDGDVTIKGNLNVSGTFNKG